VAVIGGTGFVGRAVAARLGSDHEVVVAGLPGSRPAELTGVTVVEGDLLADGAALAAALRGADAVVYALAPRRRRRAGGLPEAAARVAAAAASARVRHWVHLSNVSVYPPSEAWVEDTTPPAPHHPLGHATLRMERVVEDRVAGVGAAVTFLRMGPVYTLSDALPGVWSSYVEPGANWLSFVLRDDVAAATLLALAGRLPRVCVVGDGAPARAVEAASIAARRRDTRPRALSEPAARRLGPDTYGTLVSSVRLRPAALLAAGWRPTVASLAAAARTRPGRSA
jgi:nucleoside-diphosphate-sugar epimerase